MSGQHLCPNERSVNLNVVCGVPIHHHSNTLEYLDVLMSRNTSRLLTDIEVEHINLCDDDGDLIKDHYSLNVRAPQQQCEVVSYRNVKEIGINQFCEDIRVSHQL